MGRVGSKTLTYIQICNGHQKKKYTMVLLDISKRKQLRLNTKYFVY